MNLNLAKNLVFIIKFLFDFYLYILILRLFLQKSRAPYYNPISQAVIRFTDFLIKPTQKLIPGYRGFDFAILFWIIILQMLAFFLIIWIGLSGLPNPVGLFIMAIGEVINKTINLLFFAILIYAIISWFPSLQKSVITPVVDLIASPCLILARRVVPIIGGFDFSPILILIVLKLLSLFIVNPIIHLGEQLVSGGF